MLYLRLIEWKVLCSAVLCDLRTNVRPCSVHDVAGSVHFFCFFEGSGAGTLPVPAHRGRDGGGVRRSNKRMKDEMAKKKIAHNKALFAGRADRLEENSVHRVSVFFTLHGNPPAYYSLSSHHSVGGDTSSTVGAWVTGNRPSSQIQQYGHDSRKFLASVFLTLICHQGSNKRAVSTIRKR